MFRLALAFSILPIAALAQERIVLPEGATHTVVQGTGDVTYVLNAGAGQTLNLTLSDGTLAIFPPGDETPSFQGAVFSGLLPEEGDYTVAVQSAAPFALDIAITNDTAPGAPVLPQ
ncbi:hypothetical protein [Falsirhodobacter sp. 20TX0035]|uniref:hypothetical protein n=1 Tax=Falsirhodobacter sp. 20TX0035 TaxID=3022019 RepID=UPI00233101A8|nr:hypothetical protein [Falsirhodobacter sp. 20TX0035]MDB6452212.1 hypothetical protein [Falsirhodobacter sp. 20TX0035]